MVLRKLIIITLFIGLFTGCIKYELPKAPEPVLPAETKEGKNTIGCLVNKKVWLPGGNAFLSFKILLTVHYDYWGFEIYASKIYREEDRVDEFEIKINKSDLKEGTFLIKEWPDSGARFHFYNKTDTCEYFSSNEYGGKINITKLDTTNKIIAGTFEMKFVNGKCQDLNITDGRFDFKYPH